MKIEKDCLNTCKFKGSRKTTYCQRQSLFNTFYNLKNHEGIRLYLFNCTKNLLLLGRRENLKIKLLQGVSFLFGTFSMLKLNGWIQVWKRFFLSTLAISQKPTYNVHKNKDPQTNLPKTDQRGHKASNRIPEYAKNDVRHHIQ